MIPAAIHARIIPQLCELLSDSVSWSAMTAPTTVSVALARVIARRMFWPNTAEKFPSLRVTQFTGFWLRSWQLGTKPSRLLRPAAARELAPQHRGPVEEK